VNALYTILGLLLVASPLMLAGLLIFLWELFFGDVYGYTNPPENLFTYLQMKIRGWK